MGTKVVNKIDPELLEDAPLGLLTTGSDGRVGWANQAMAGILGITAAELAGRRLDDLPAAAGQLLHDEPQLLHDAEAGRWLRRSVRRNAAGERLFLLADVTEQEQLAQENARLRQQVEDLKLTDDLTGLANRRAISQALDLQVSRSRRYQNPLSVVLVQVDVQASGGVQPLSADPVILAVSRFLRDRLRWVDQIARWDDSVFLLVLPETGEAEARGLLDKLSSEQDGIELPPGYEAARARLGFGLACWNKGDDMRSLLRHAALELRSDSSA